MVKSKSKDQLTLSFDGEPAQPKDRCILEVDSPSYPPSDDERRQCGCQMCLKDLARSWRQDMVEQIRRDMQAYREENESPWWKEFYRERMEAYRASVLKFDKEGGV